MIEVTVPMPDAIVSRIEALGDDLDRLADELNAALAEEWRIIDDWHVAAVDADPTLAYDYDPSRGNLWWNRHDPHLGRITAALSRIVETVEAR